VHDAAVTDRRMRLSSHCFTEPDPLYLKDAKSLLSELAS
jgi:hypothetical protein